MHSLYYLFQTWLNFNLLYAQFTKGKQIQLFKRINFKRLFEKKNIVFKLNLYKDVKCFLKFNLLVLVLNN